MKNNCKWKAYYKEVNISVHCASASCLGGSDQRTSSTWQAMFSLNSQRGKNLLVCRTQVWQDSTVTSPQANYMACQSYTFHRHAEKNYSLPLEKVCTVEGWHLGHLGWRWTSTLSFLISNSETSVKAHIAPNYQIDRLHWLQVADSWVFFMHTVCAVKYSKECTRTWTYWNRSELRWKCTL